MNQDNLGETLKPYICAMLKEAGYERATSTVMDALAVIYRDLVFNIARKSRAYAELSGRKIPLPQDLYYSILDNGVDVTSLHKFNYKFKKPVQVPVKITRPKMSNVLQVGAKQPLPKYMPSHLPPFPDPHTYLYTPTHRKPITEYEAIREKVADHKESVENAMIKYKIRTQPCESLFFDVSDPTTDIYALLKPMPRFPAYLSALLPKDQYDEDFEDEPVKKKAQVSNNVEMAESVEDAKPESETIDNPYLRSVKSFNNQTYASASGGVYRSKCANSGFNIK